MEMTLRVPELDNKEFNFNDSVRNQKIITKMMRDGYQEQVDSQDTDEEDVDTSDFSFEEKLKYEQKHIKSEINAFNQKLKIIDSLINSFANIFGLKGKSKEVLEELSLDQLGNLLAHLTVRINNPSLTEDEYWEIMKAGETKK